LKAKFELFYRSIGAQTGGSNDNNLNPKVICEASSVHEDSSTGNASLPSSITSAIPPTNFVPVLMKKHHLLSQDDSSAVKGKVPDNANFNPKSRPSL
jgi:hypothetical protein